MTVRPDFGTPTPYRDWRHEIAVAVASADLAAGVAYFAGAATGCDCMLAVGATHFMVGALHWIELWLYGATGDRRGRDEG